MDKVEQTYWDQSFPITTGLVDDAVTRWLVPFINGKSGSAFEPGTIRGATWLTWVDVDGPSVEWTSPKGRNRFCRLAPGPTITTGMIRRGDVLQYIWPVRLTGMISFSFGFIGILKISWMCWRSTARYSIPAARSSLPHQFCRDRSKTLHRWLDAENLSRHHRLHEAAEMEGKTGSNGVPGCLERVFRPFRLLGRPAVASGLKKFLPETHQPTWTFPALAAQCLRLAPTADW